jgi:hypothetical protein
MKLIKPVSKLKFLGLESGMVHEMFLKIDHGDGYSLVSIPKKKTTICSSLAW